MVDQSDKPAAPPAGSAGAVEQERPWRPGLLLVLILGVFYGILQNGQWVPISDADLYIAVARNLVLGKGFVFNGLPVQATPPGWPLFLAGAMRVSSSFWFLGIVQILLMLGALLLFYRIMLRLTTPGRAFLVCLTLGVLSPAYHRTLMLYTEPLFCVLLAGAILLAVQVNEGRGAGWRLPALVALCIAASSVRWAGVLLSPVVAGALLSGHLRPAWNKLWVTAALVVVLSGATFLALRYMPSPVPNQTVAKVEDQTEITTYTARKHPIVRRLRGAAGRAPWAGLWFAELVAEPAHIERTFLPVRIGVNLVGWVLFGFVMAGTVPFVRRRQWMLPAAFLYSLVLIVLWGKPVARYLVPVGPLLILALLDGVDMLARVGPSPRWRQLSRLTMAVLFVGIAVNNLSLYAVDLWKLHSRDFYGGYFAGQAKPLIAIADYLKSQHVKDCEVATIRIDLQWEGVSPSMGFFLEIRGLSLLIDRTILLAPRNLSQQSPNAELAQWLGDNKVKYYVYRPPVNPWRVWHFRIPRIQEMVTGRPVGETNPYFALYELKDGGLQEVQVPPWEGRIDRVPGL
jgi:hypothetical protein